MDSDILLEKFEDLKQKEKEARTEADKAKGALETYRTRLKEEFGCFTMSAAKKKLKKLQKDLKETESEFKEALDAFTEEWDSRDES